MKSMRIQYEINYNILRIIEKAVISLLAGKYARILCRNSSFSLLTFGKWSVVVACEYTGLSFIVQQQREIYARLGVKIATIP